MKIIFVLCTSFANWTEEEQTEMLVKSKMFDVSVANIAEDS